MGLLKYLLILIIGFCFGAYFDFYQGPIEYVNINAQNEASLLVSEITLLKSGENDSLISLKEAFLNEELANHGRYLESWFSWLLPHKISYDSEHNIQKAVEYRLAHPYSESEFSDENLNSDVVIEINLDIRERNRLIGNVLETYNQE